MPRRNHANREKYGFGTRKRKKTRARPCRRVDLEKLYEIKKKTVAFRFPGKQLWQFKVWKLRSGAFSGKSMSTIGYVLKTQNAL